VKEVRFLEEALEEFLEQVAYYEGREKGLGERFRLAVQAATALAATHPKLGSTWKLGTRRVFPKGFKFSVVYRIKLRSWSFLRLRTSVAGQLIGAAAGDAKQVDGLH
jgi:toxin ParE1/3/4